MTLKLKFACLEGRYALAQLPAGSPVPSWPRGAFAAILLSPDGITVVSEADAVPEGVAAQPGFRCLAVVGAFELSSVGVAAAAAQPIAAAGISLFIYSTWQTDYVLVQEKDLPYATAALTVAGHAVY